MRDLFPPPLPSPGGMAWVGPCGNAGLTQAIPSWGGKEGTKGGKAMDKVITPVHTIPHGNVGA